MRKINKLEKETESTIPEGARFIMIDKDNYHIYRDKNYTYWYELKQQRPILKAMAQGGYDERKTKEI